MDDRIRLFDPKRTDELLRGWQLHVMRRRLAHERAARRLQSLTYAIGVPTAVLAGVAGSSAFAAWRSSTSEGSALAIIGGVVGLAAAVLASVQTFLDLGAKAEANRQAAVVYKRMLRKLERIPPEKVPLAELRATDPALADELEQLETALGEADGAAPVVPQGLARRIESLPVDVIDSIDRNPTPTPPP